MKIVHVTQFFAPIGGIEQYILNLLPLLSAKGIENVVVYWANHPRTLPAGTHPVHQITAANIPAFVAKQRPDVVYLHAVREPSLITALTGRWQTLAYVHDFHLVCPGLAKYFYRWGTGICQRPYGLGCVPNIYWHRCATAKNPVSVYRIMKQVKDYLAAHRQLSGLLVASSYMRQLLIQNGLEPGRVHLLPHFTVMPAVPPPFPAGGPPTLLYVGRLEHEKGLPVLFRALGQLVATPFQLLIAGEGSRRVEYEAMVSQLGLTGRVQFLGWLAPAGLEQAYRQAHCLVLPAVWPEPFGMVGIDAFGYARPVIAFNVGGISDWLQDGYNGFLVPPQDETQLTNRLQILLTTPTLAAEMGRNGRLHAETHHRPEQHLNQLLKLSTHAHSLPLHLVSLSG